MTTPTLLDTLIDLEHAAHLDRIPPHKAEADVVGALCGPWWRRWLRPGRVALVRQQFRAIRAAREAAARRLEARKQKDSVLWPHKRSELVRLAQAGHSFEDIERLLFLTPEQSAVARTGYDYVRATLERYGATELKAPAQAQPPAPPLTKAEREFVVRRIVEGASDESIIADVEAVGPRVDVVRRRLDYARKVLCVNESAAKGAKAASDNAPFALIDLNLVAAVPASPPLNMAEPLPEVDASDRS